jgi:hypothetical protein
LSFLIHTQPVLEILGLVKKTAMQQKRPNMIMNKEVMTHLVITLTENSITTK